MTDSGWVQPHPTERWKYGEVDPAPWPGASVRPRYRATGHTPRNSDRASPAPTHLGATRMRPHTPSPHPRLWATPGALIAMLTVGAWADEVGTVLRPDEAPGKMLYRALEGQARARLEARRKAVAALKTPEAIRDRQQEIRAKFLEA